jgi:hypothetical protein
MKGLEVSLDISTELLSLGDLSNRIGRPSKRYSHDKGDRRPSLGPSPEVWGRTVWRLVSKKSRRCSLLNHLRNLEEQFPPKARPNPSDLPPDCDIKVVIAVFYDTFTMSLPLSNKELDLIRSFGGSAELVCYPTENGR